MIIFYRDTASFLTKLHPVTRLLSLIILFIPPFCFTHPIYVLPYFLLLILGAVAFHAIYHVLRLSWLVFIFLLMSVLLWPFFYKGISPLFTLGKVTIMLESVLYGLTIGLRLDSFFVLGIIFLTATRLEDLSYALHKLGLPYTLSFAMGLAFRLTPLFTEAGQNVVIAQKSRGHDLDQGSLWQRIKKHIPIIVPVLFIGLRSADQLAIALESRGFGLKTTRTSYLAYQVTWRDVVALSLVSVLAAAAMASWICGWGQLPA